MFFSRVGGIQFHINLIIYGLSIKFKRNKKTYLVLIKKSIIFSAGKIIQSDLKMHTW